MNTTYCDRCHFEWQLSEDDIKTLDLNENTGARMRFFQCPECGAEYVIDVTDRELRKNIAIFKKMNRKYRRMYNNKESETRLSNYLTRLNAKRQELLNNEAELRRRYLGAK